MTDNSQKIVSEYDDSFGLSLNENDLLFVKNHVKKYPYMENEKTLSEYINKIHKMKRETQKVGNYLTGEAWKIGTILSVKIADTGRLEKSSFNDNQILVVKVDVISANFNGKDVPIEEQHKGVFDFGLSSFNENQVQSLYGQDTDKWKDCPLEIMVESSSKAKSGKRLTVITE